MPWLTASSSLLAAIFTPILKVVIFPKYPKAHNPHILVDHSSMFEVIHLPNEFQNEGSVPK